MFIDRIDVRWDFIIFLVVAVLLLPFYLVTGWFFAATIHELCHIIALTYFKVSIYQITLRANGAIIRTDTMQLHQEMICALAGPLGGILGFFLLRVNPYIAVFSLIQSFYNLLPVYPADGGRALRCLLTIMFSEHKALIISNRISILLKVFFVIFVLILIYLYH